MRDMRNLKLVPPPIDDPEQWKRLLNYLYVTKQDSLFCWLQDVRRYVEAQEREKRRGAA